MRSPSSIVPGGSVYSFAVKAFKILLVLILILKIESVYSQPYYFVESHGQSLHDAGKEISSAGWIYFYDTIHISNISFIDVYFSELGMGVHDSLGLEKSEIDAHLMSQVNGFAFHEYYNQYYKGLRVEGAELTIHSVDSSVYMIQGKLIDSLDFRIDDVISEEVATENAIKYIDATDYAWQVDSTESYPVPELLLAHQPGTTLEKSNYLLCYLLTINAEVPFSSNDVYINANTGDVAFTRSNTRICDGENGTGVTNFYGTQNLEIRHRWLQNDFILENCEKYYETKDFGGGGGPWWLEGNVTDGDGNFTGSINAVTAHWTTGVTTAIYENVFGLHGMYGHNTKLRLYIDHLDEAVAQSPYYTGGFATPRIYIGGLDLPGPGVWNTLDVLAHEWTHGVTDSHSGLVYESESGALNESFSDIFGKVIESREATTWTANGVSHTANPNVSFSWFLGDDGGTAVRSMSIPSVSPFFQPSEFEGTFWINTVGCSPTNGNDQCGVHTNSGVQNHWFFLLSDGSDINAQLTGIGIESASRIAYRNMMTYIQENSDYQDARLGAIQSTRDLFGVCSEEDFQNLLAWSEVGLGGPPSWCVNLEGSKLICLGRYEDEIGEYHVTTLDHAEITWINLDPSWTYQISGANNENLTVSDWGNSGGTLSPPCTRIGVSVTVDHVTVVRYINVCFENCGDGHPRNTVTSLQDKNESNTFNLFPNPAKNEFFIQSNYKSKATFYMYDLLMQKVMEGEVENGVNRVTMVNNLSTGTYILSIFDTDRNQVYNKIIIVNK